MARFVLLLLIVAVATNLLAALTFAAAKEHLVGSVIFLEGGKQEYLRRSDTYRNVEEDVFTREDTAATVAVLLGVPPIMLSAASSAKLDSVLSPNPFKRPRAVLALDIKGAVFDSLADLEEIFVSSSFQRRSFSVNAHQRPVELLGHDVMLHLLNNRDYEYGMEQHGFAQLEQGLEDLVSFLGASSHKDEETGNVVLKTGLALDDGVSISLDLEKRADWEFAVELLSLFECVHSSKLKEFLHGNQNLAKLSLGTFTALELMEKDSNIRRDATKLFLHTAIRVLVALDAECDGQIVGLFEVSSIVTETTVLPTVNAEESRWSRYLLDRELAPSPIGTPNTTLLDAEVEKLLRRSHVFVTILILLIATLLGSFFLLCMPLTRDTLLYAAVKLD